MHVTLGKEERWVRYGEVVAQDLRPVSDNELLLGPSQYDRSFRGESMKESAGACMDLEHE
jgi:hypothetical protein